MMIKIRLFCVAGMLSNTLVSKMNDAAKLMQLEVDIQAFPQIKMSTQLDNVDVVLLGPQIAYKLSEAKSICEPLGIAVDVISMVDFGMMNGDKILHLALKLIDELKERLVNEAIKNEIAEREASEQAAKETLKNEISTKEIAQKTSQEKILKDTEEKNTLLEIKNDTTYKEVIQKLIEKKSSNDSLIENAILNTTENGISETSNQIIIDETSKFTSYNAIIIKIKELFLNAQKEIYINTNIDISIFKDEIIETSQKDIKLTFLLLENYSCGELPIDKLYTYVDEKRCNKNTFFMIVVDGSYALVTEDSDNKEEIPVVITNNKILVSIIYKNILNTIYLLKLRDNIAFKLKDI